ncbi:hypothetical protein J4E83_007179 [Alternaria metachromatica]|uniref:uncharacterized protein n=1 Tax=Alternaria metachromatica TaxID=283354 RepID=UPI0020C4FE8E|nr:uncharacterized protein J4E83_007179 [Alternaria metachromatica]KAI4614525.1 hypothetical protein J4E83_007179 [Alternaria metachromatica]
MAQHTPVECTGVRPVNTTTADPIGIPLPALLRLPRELRDLIYDEYVRVDGGYIYKPETHKLAHADGSPIGLSLRLVCRQLAAEFQGLALKLNTITFETCFSEASREDAGMYHTMIKQIAWRKTEVVKTFAPQLFTPIMAKAVADIYPRLSPLVEGWSTRSEPELEVLATQEKYCGEAPSIWRDCINTVLSQISEHPDFDVTVQEEGKASRRYWIPDNADRMSKLVDVNPAPWHIPNRKERDQLAIVTGVEPEYPWYKQRTKYTYSAASLALQFLRSLPDSALMAIRNIILAENHETVTHPECHGRGFVEICRQYPKIRIQRFASLWKAVFPVELGTRLDYSSFNEDGEDASLFERDRLEANDITYAVGIWMTEVLVLPLLGMPPGCFTLILDGNPTPDYMTQIFKVVQRDVAFQAALDIAYATGSLPSPTWIDRRLRTGYTFDVLPGFIQTLSTDSPLVRCNFDPGQPHDANKLLDEHRGWTLQDWENSWDTHSPRRFQTEAPLPPWHELRWQYVIV